MKSGPFVITSIQVMDPDSGSVESAAVSTAVTPVIPHITTR
jgi:hypothetical protein